MAASRRTHVQSAGRIHAQTRILGRAGRAVPVHGADGRRRQGAPRQVRCRASPDAALATPQSETSSGSVTVEGHRIDYKAVAGTIMLHGKGDDENTPTASIFYVAYFKKGADPSKRPITFLYNGGPGSASVWLHMGAFGPRRVVTSDHDHTPAAPYKLVNNDYSLLDASDLVFIDAPGTGFSRLIAKTDKDKRERCEGAPEAVLRRRRRRPGLRPVHHPVPVQVRPLELAQVPVRRELRHHAFGGAGRPSREPRTPSTSTA